MSENPEETTPTTEDALAELETLRINLADAKSKAAEFYDQLLRSRAEFDNFRKRVEREKTEARQWGKQEVLMELIALVDVFEQAMAHAHKAKELSQVIEGVTMLHKNFAQFLKSEGLEPIDATGKPFDPATAEVMTQEEVEADQAGQVLEELQKGYLFKGHVLRPSRVRVGVAKKQEEAPKEEKKPSKKENKKHKENEETQSDS